MKILWVKGDFLHPTTRGGQIRTLEMLRRLHRKHEVHYVAFENPAQPEGLKRSPEYCFRAYPVKHYVPDHKAAAFYVQVAAGLFHPLPVAISRYRARAMEQLIESLIRQQGFDRLVCDFLSPSPNVSHLQPWVLFQHNVETMIWRRHVENASDPIRRFYLKLQADRMFAYERRVCQAVDRIVAVSASDAELMRTMFQVTHVSAVPTGVDVDWFAPPPEHPRKTDLVFVGSMDWLPNIDGVRYFVREILPLIRRRRPACSVAIVGKSPSAEILALTRRANMTVTGTVPDVRPYFWEALVSIVPLRIGGGTRLKIYESMAAGTPVVSTSIGAEGLAVQHPATIRLADTPEAFAEQCLELLENPPERQRMAGNARELVSSRFSWEHAASVFEQILEQDTRS